MSEDLLKKTLDELNGKLSTITDSIKKSEKNLNERITTSELAVIDHIDKKYNELSEQIEKLENRILTLENEVDCQSAKIAELEKESAAKSNYIAEMEMKINRCNLIVYNFEEKEVTSEELVSNLVKFFKEVMKVILEHSDIDVVYRIGKETPHKVRPVFVSLTTMKMKNYIFSCRRNLMGSKVSISEDCPKEIIEKRKKLLPALLGAKKLKKKAFFKYGNLIVNGVACTDEDIQSYSKSYAESAKRPRSMEIISPTSNIQEAKKPKNLSAIVRSTTTTISKKPNGLSGIVKNATKPRTHSESSVAGSSKQITQFFNSTTSRSPNTQTVFMQYDLDK